MQRTLADVRADIDAIDDALQDLLIRRTALVEEVREIKRDWRVKIQPSREADIICRLIARHHGAFPRRELVAIWRILICATLSFEGPFSVAAYVPADGASLEDTACWDVAREHFGPCTPIVRHGSVRGVIEAVHRQDVTVGVLPLPRHEEADPWWRHLVTTQPDAPKIIARLPFAAPAPSTHGLRTGGGEALAICPVQVVPTGRDRAFLAGEADSRLGLGRLSQALREAGFTARFSSVCQDTDTPKTWLYLAEVEGALAADDPRLDEIRRALGAPLSRLVVLGGYALPLVLETAHSEAAAPASATAVAAEGAAGR